MCLYSCVSLIWGIRDPPKQDYEVFIIYCLLPTKRGSLLESVRTVRLLLEHIPFFKKGFLKNFSGLVWYFLITEWVLPTQWTSLRNCLNWRQQGREREKGANWWEHWVCWGLQCYSEWLRACVNACHLSWTGTILALWEL